MKKAWFLSILALCHMVRRPGAGQHDYLSGDHERARRVAAERLSRDRPRDYHDRRRREHDARPDQLSANLVTTGTGTTASHIHCCTAVPCTGTASSRHADADVHRLPAQRSQRDLRPYVRPRVGLDLEPGVHHREWQHRGLCGSRVPRRPAANGTAYLNIHSSTVRGRRDSRIHPGGAGAGDNLVAWPRALQSGGDRRDAGRNRHVRRVA